MKLLSPSVFVSDEDLVSIASELATDKQFWMGESDAMTDYPLMMIVDGNKSGHSVKEIRHSIMFASLVLKLDLINCRVTVSQGTRKASHQVDAVMASQIRQYYADNHGILNEDRLGRTVSSRYQFITDNRIHTSEVQ